MIIVDYEPTPFSMDLLVYVCYLPGKGPTHHIFSDQRSPVLLSSDRRMKSMCGKEFNSYLWAGATSDRFLSETIYCGVCIDLLKSSGIDQCTS